MKLNPNSRSTIHCAASRIARQSATIEIIRKVNDQLQRTLLSSKTFMYL